MTSSRHRLLITIGIVSFLLLLAIGAWYVVVFSQGDGSRKAPVSAEQNVDVSPQDNSSALHVIALGDIACSSSDIGNDGEEGRLGRCHMKTVADRAIAETADLYLGLGDQQYEEGSRDAFLTGFDRVWGSVKDRFFPTPGNHEYKTAGAQGYFDYFNGDGKEIGRAGKRSEGWYRLDRPGWNIIVLNSNCDEIGGCNEEAPQTQWLIEQLTTNPQPCTIVTFHHPRWTSGRYLGLTDQTNRSAAWWTVFQEYDVDLILNGHDHLYERFGALRADGSRSSEGTRAFTIGTGGKSLYSVRDQQLQSDVVIDDHYGFLRLTLNQGSYQWEFVTEDGRVLDRGSDRCH